MRKALRAAALTFILTLVLTSCDILFMGVFPADIAQATARRDLSSSISAANASSFHLSVVKSGKHEFVILASDINFDTALPHLLVLSPELGVQNVYTMDELAAFMSVALSGTAAIAHLNDGKIVIGNLETTVTASGLALSASLSASSVSINNWAVQGPSPNYYTWSGFRSDSSNTLFYSEWAADWSLYNTKTATIATGSTRYEIEGVFTDPEDATNDTALLVFREQSGNDSLFHFISATKESNLFGMFVGGPIMEDTAFTSSQIVKSNLKSGSVNVTSDGIIAYNERSRSLVFFDPADPANEKPLHVGNTANDTQWAFSFSGGYYCTWNPDTRVLTRYEDWW
jgi:hypothetical protein